MHNHNELSSVTDILGNKHQGHFVQLIEVISLFLHQIKIKKKNLGHTHVRIQC